MSDLPLTNLRAVAVAAFAAPLALGLVPALRLPAVVLELSLSSVSSSARSGAALVAAGLVPVVGFPLAATALLAGGCVTERAPAGTVAGT